MRRRPRNPVLRWLRVLAVAALLVLALPLAWFVARGLAGDRDLAAAWRAFRAPAPQAGAAPNGAALKTGFSRARGELIGFLDADGTYPPESLVRMCEVALRRNADVVIGSRRSGGASGMPFIRRIGNLIWSSLLSLIGNTAVADPSSGLRLLHRRHQFAKLRAASPRVAGTAVIILEPVDRVHADAEHEIGGIPALQQE